MVCLFCKSETDVVNSRPQRRTNSIWRRRQCHACGQLFTTTELFDTSSAIRIATNNSSESFSRDRLFLSIFQACEHLPDAIEVATALTATIIGRLLAAIDSPTVPVHTLTELAAKTLKRYDSAAFIRYMSSRASLKNSRSLKALLKD